MRWQVAYKRPGGETEKQMITADNMIIAEKEANRLCGFLGAELQSFNVFEDFPERGKHGE